MHVGNDHSIIIFIKTSLFIFMGSCALKINFVIGPQKNVVFFNLCHLFLTLFDLEVTWSIFFYYRISLCLFTNFDLDFGLEKSSRGKKGSVKYQAHTVTWLTNTCAQITNPSAFKHFKGFLRKKRQRKKNLFETQNLDFHSGGCWGRAFFTWRY